LLFHYSYFNSKCIISLSTIVTVMTVTAIHTTMSVVKVNSLFLLRDTLT